MNSPAARQIYLDNFNDIVERQVERYQQVLTYACSKVDFGIANGVYMIPSNTMLNMGNIEGYNNKLLIANKIGMVNLDINQKSPPSIKHPLDHIDKKSEKLQRVGGSPIQLPLMHDDGLLSENDKKLSKEHSEESEALIIAGEVLIIAGIYFFK